MKNILKKLELKQNNWEETHDISDVFPAHSEMEILRIHIRQEDSDMMTVDNFAFDIDPSTGYRTYVSSGEFVTSDFARRLENKK